MGGVESVPTPRETKALEKQDSLTEKHPVTNRPAFLDLSPEQLKESKNHETRPILSPSDATKLPWNSGYAESINAGKSLNRNEDQASFSYEVIQHREQDEPEQEDLPTRMFFGSMYSRADLPERTPIPVWFFGVFDGHAGGGAAMYSAHVCHQHVFTRLASIRHFLAHPDRVIQPEEDVAIGYTSPPIDVRDLIRGAIEQAFFDIDNQLREDRLVWRIIGGCTVITSIFLDQTLYVANAGDCRAIIVRDGQIIKTSTDFTPETDRQRVQAIAYMQPQLLGDFFGRLQFQRRIRNRDMGQPVLCRDKHMTGWAYKIVEDEDIKRMPMVQGEGKRARLLATIATTRGFGDHDLEAPGGLYIKPFLSPMPEIRSYDLTDHESMSYDDVLISATDGLWERLTNEEARDVVEKVFAKRPANDPQRYMIAARDLVQAARGQLTCKGWRTEQDQFASGDDITCFVIPLKKAAQNMSSTTFRRDAPESSMDLATEDSPDVSGEAEKGSEYVESSEQKSEDAEGDSTGGSNVDDQPTDRQEGHSDDTESKDVESKSMSDYEIV